MMIVKMPALPATTNVTATGGDSNYGVYNNSSFPTIRNSSITGTTNSIFNDGSTAQVADTMLDGQVVAGNGIACVGAYDETFSALNAQCSMQLTSAE
jgi:hypothetical protein